MKSQTWNKIVIMGTLAVLAVCAAATIYIDPFFHYHAPLQEYQYPINEERYQNDGIVKHFEYDALITGSSMCENFKTTEFDEASSECVSR